MSIRTVSNFVDTLEASQLLSREQMEQLVMNLQSGFAEPAELAEDLIHRGWLTVYQAKQVFLGNQKDLLIGPYVVLDLIGGGAMGRVYKARQRRLDRLVALKVVRPDKVNHPAALERFHQEVQAAARLSHPNIVSTFDADRVDDRLYMAMEYVEGVNLARLVKSSGPLPVGLACDYVRQAAQALQHAHQRGLVHRDVKPSNLLLTSDRNQIKILDLGLALLNDPNKQSPEPATETPSGIVMGTPDFMAPEQALDSDQVDSRADIYSLGCTLYFLLVGQPPFPRGNLTQKLMHHQQIEPEAIERKNPGVPTELGDVIRRMMAKKPEDRFQTPVEAAVALEPFLKLGAGLLSESSSAIRLPELTPPPPTRIDVTTSSIDALDAETARRLQKTETRFWLLMALTLIALVSGLIVFAVWLLRDVM